MIISHKYKFIFIKPKKVAGTSIEVALGKYCGEKDILTPVSDFTSDNDDTFYAHRARNFGTFYNHITPDLIKNKVDPEIWNSYYKFTVVRNPWDYLVSYYIWRSKIVSKPLFKRYSDEIKALFKNPNHLIWFLVTFARTMKIFYKKQNFVKGCSFKYFIENLNDNNMNTKFYFDANGNKVADFYIRYEHLNEDYKKICEKLGVPYEELPKLKSRVRKEDQHYSKYYDKYLKELVGKKLKREIEEFGYKFEEK